jgi:hypothetical protein
VFPAILGSLGRDAAYFSQKFWGLLSYFRFAAPIQNRSYFLQEIFLAGSK